MYFFKVGLVVLWTVGFSLPAQADIVECDGFLRSNQNPRLTGNYLVGVDITLPGIDGRGYIELSNRDREFFSYQMDCVTAAGFPGPTSCLEDSRDSEKFSAVYFRGSVEVSIVNDFRTIEVLGDLSCR